MASAAGEALEASGGRGAWRVSVVTHHDAPRRARSPRASATRRCCSPRTGSGLCSTSSSAARARVRGVPAQVLQARVPPRRARVGRRARVHHLAAEEPRVEGHLRRRLHGAVHVHVLLQVRRAKGKRPRRAAGRRRRRPSRRRERERGEGARSASRGAGRGGPRASSGPPGPSGVEWAAAGERRRGRRAWRRARRTTRARGFGSRRRREGGRREGTRGARSAWTRARASATGTSSARGYTTTSVGSRGVRR